MEVILKEDVNNLGHRGDVVKVADGYGRNYLLPKKLAMEANAANKAVIEQMKASAVRRSAKEKTEAEALVQQLNNVALVFERKVGENDHLFGSVTSRSSSRRRASTSTAARCTSKSRSSRWASSTCRSSFTAK
jgi:large subunit ribosomal protein L9